jgi:VIT1/CCC1 family predicted Fe2+/Mn2+ transporter
MSGNGVARKFREPILSPVERVSELLFGLFMALTFVGAVSVAEGGRAEIRDMFVAALGCNLAWGLVDAVMYLVGEVADRGRRLTLMRSVRSVADAGVGHRLIERALSRAPAGDLVSPPEIEAIRGRIVGLPDVPARPSLERDDLIAALAIFLIVVGSTFPVVLPFIMIQDVETAKHAIAVAMLFFGGLALGRYAGYSSWKSGALMAGIGTVLVVAIIALGG